MSAWVSAVLMAVCVAGALGSPRGQAVDPGIPSKQAAEPDSPWEQAAQPGASSWPVEVLEWLPNGCPARADVPWLLPGPFCHLYWACDHGNKIPMRCPLGLHFNRFLQVCDFPGNAGCCWNIVAPWNI